MSTNNQAFPPSLRSFDTAVEAVAERRCFELIHLEMQSAQYVPVPVGRSLRNAEFSNVSNPACQGEHVLSVIQTQIVQHVEGIGMASFSPVSGWSRIRAPNVLMFSSEN